jgi:uncharacterized protein (DUF1697 family)
MRYVVLLRGINVGGNKKVPMADLKALCTKLGATDVVTYINSGNVVLTSATDLREPLEQAIAKKFGFEVPVVTRTEAQWRKIAACDPFPDAVQARPHILHAGISRDTLKKDVVTACAPYCKAGEQMKVDAGVLWIDFNEGVARSKLTPTVLDRCAGSPLTARNWNTVQKLAAML